MHRSWRTLGLSFLLAAFSVATLRATTFTVQVGAAGLTFTPANQPIFVGDTVHWVWAAGPHSTTSGTCSGTFTCTADGVWDSGIQSVNATFDHTFSNAGTFPYFCQVHLGMMTGVIVVRPPAQFNTVTPCRIADTRGAQGPYGAPSLTAGADRIFVIASQCGIPMTASSVSFNLTATQGTAPGDLRAGPGGGAPLPLVSTLNWSAGQTRANNAVVGLGPAGDLVVHVDQPGGTVDLIIDVNGYFE